MLTTILKQLCYRATRQVIDLDELTRQLTIRRSVFDMYADTLSAVNLTGDSTTSTKKCLSCSGTGYKVDEDLFEMAKWVRSQRPIADIEIDQCALSDIDLARRIHALLESHNPSDTSFAFVGDDDLASLLLLHVSAPHKVLVVDIDDRILNVIQNNSTSDMCSELRLINMNLAQLSINIEKLTQDIETYDVVVTDPPYAEGGMLTFIYTASMLLKLGGKIYLAVPHLVAEAWTNDLMQLIQSELLALGFVIDASIPGFFAYNESDGFSSLLVATKRRSIEISSLLENLSIRSQHNFYPPRKRLFEDPM